MKKGSRLEEYREGYGLIRDKELNRMFNDYLDIIEDNMFDRRISLHSHYWVFYTDKNMDEFGRATYNIKEISYLKSKGVNFPKHALKIAKNHAQKAAEEFVSAHPHNIPIMSIFCLSAGFLDKDTKEVNNGLLISGQTKDGRCCMAQYKLMMDGINVCGHELIDEYIPKKHTNDEDYEWGGNTAFFEEVDRLRAL